MMRLMWFALSCLVFAFWVWLIRCAYKAGFEAGYRQGHRAGVGDERGAK
jgi:hypothetical protein